MIDKTEQKIMQNWKGNTKTPLLSICAITYNHEQFVEQTLDGFLMQETDFAFEIVLSDDCSTDKNAEVIKKYIDKYPTIVNAKLRSVNVGMTLNGSENLKRAKGKYIALCEGDDYWTDPLKLQKQVDFLEKNEEYVITYTSVEGIDQNGKKNGHIGGARKDLEGIELQKGTPLNTLTVCFRNVIKSFPPERQCAKFGDIFLWSLLGAYGKGKYLNDIAPARYRIHSGGVFSKKTSKEKASMIYLTNFALYSYYHRINNSIIRDYFHNKCVNSSLSIYGRLYYIKIIFKSIINGRVYYIKNMIKSVKNITQG